MCVYILALVEHTSFYIPQMVAFSFLYFIIAFSHTTLLIESVLSEAMQSITQLILSPCTKAYLFSGLINIFTLEWFSILIEKQSRRP